MCQNDQTMNAMAYKTLTSDPFYLSLGPVHYVPCIKWDQGHPHQRSHSGISLILISQHLVRVLEPLMQYVHRLVGVFRQAVCPHQLRRNPVCSPSWCIAECFVQIWLSVYHLLKGFRPQCYHTVLQSVTWIMRSGVVILKKGTFCKISESMRLQKLDLSTEVSAALASAARVLLQTLPRTRALPVNQACMCRHICCSSIREHDETSVLRSIVFSIAQEESKQWLNHRLQWGSSWNPYYSSVSSDPQRHTLPSSRHKWPCFLCYANSQGWFQTSSEERLFQTSDLHAIFEKLVRLTT